MDTDTRISLGRQLRNSRLQKELTMEDIANKLETSKQNISRYEKGDYKKPDIELLSKLANILEIDLSKFGVNTITITDIANSIYGNKSGENLKVDKTDLLNTEPKSWVDEKIKHLEEVIKLKNELIEELRRNK